MWALKHTMRTISELGLEILQMMLRKFLTTDAQAAQTFYQIYYLETMQHIFAVVAECSHTSGKRKLTLFVLFNWILFFRFNCSFANIGKSFFNC
jgi:hypothetical protein